MKNLVETFEVNDYPIVAPAGSCVYAIKNYPDYFTKAGELGWAERAKKVVARFCDLTDFIVNKLGVTDVGAYLPGKAVYHPSCSLTRKLGIVDEPIALLKGVKGLDLLPIHNQQTCCGFGGTFSVKMAEISGEMVKEKVEHIEEVEPQYLNWCRCKLFIKHWWSFTTRRQQDQSDAHCGSINARGEIRCH